MTAVREEEATGANPLVEALERLPVRPTALVIFGGTGDLAHRKLLPALYNLAHEGALPERFELIGVARRDQPDEDFQAIARESIEKYSRRKPDPDVLSGLLGQRQPEFLCAAGFSSSPHLMYSGFDARGEWYQLYQIGFGGIPGRPEMLNDSSLQRQVQFIPSGPDRPPQRRGFRAGVDRGHRGGQAGERGCQGGGGRVWSRGLGTRRGRHAGVTARPPRRREFGRPDSRPGAPASNSSQARNAQRRSARVSRHEARGTDRRRLARFDRTFESARGALARLRSLEWPPGPLPPAPARSAKQASVPSAVRCGLRPTDTASE